MERINVDVSDLCLWETNPRVEPSIDQMDELNKIYNFSAQSQSTSIAALMSIHSPGPASSGLMSLTVVRVIAFRPARRGWGRMRGLWPRCRCLILRLRRCL